MNFPFEVQDFTQIQEGDRIEITHLNSGDVIITTVRTANEHRITVRRGGVYSAQTIGDIFNYRILTRPKKQWQRGDTIRADQTNELPALSVIQYNEGDGHLPNIWIKSQTDNFWFYMAGSKNSADRINFNDIGGYTRYRVLSVGMETF
jgi:hypothetical protein